MRMITRTPLHAALAVALCWTTFSFAGPGDDDAVVDEVDQATVNQVKLDDAAALAEVPTLDGLINIVRDQIIQPVDQRPPTNAVSFNLRRADDAGQLGRFLDVISDGELALKLRRILGDDGYEGLKELAKSVSQASVKADPWRDVATALDAFQPKSMERLQAKRIVIMWLQNEAKLFPSSQVAAPLILQTMTPIVNAPELAHVLERVSSAMKNAKSTDHASLFLPVGYLLGLAPYLPKLQTKSQMHLFAKAVELAGANTNLSELELVEKYLLNTSMSVIRENRLYTTYGAQHAFQIGLRYFQAIVKSKYIPQGEQGSVLTSAEVLVNGIEERLVKARAENWLEKDFYWRAKIDLRAMLSELLKDHPSLLSRIEEFPGVRTAVLKQSVRVGCGAYVSDPMALLLADGN